MMKTSNKNSRTAIFEFSLDQIQAPSTVCIGLPLGTYMRIFNPNYNLMKANDHYANRPVVFYKRAITNYYGEEIKNREVYAVVTKKLTKVHYNRSRPRDMVSLPEGKGYKFVESFANNNDRRPAAGKFRLAS